MQILGRMLTSQCVLPVLLGLYVLPGAMTSVYDKTNTGWSSLPSDIPLGTTEIEFASNKLTSLGDNAFSKFTLLNKINLYGNEIATISDTAFSGTQLEYLYLQSNELTCVPHIQTVASTLTTLYLSSNNIQAFTTADFSGMVKLATIQLQNNPLTSLPDITSVLPALGVILMNSFWCCDAAWILDKSANVIVTGTEPCTEPFSLVGVAWSGITRVQLDLPCGSVPPTGDSEIPFKELFKSSRVQNVLCVIVCREIEDFLTL